MGLLNKWSLSQIRGFIFHFFDRPKKENPSLYMEYTKRPIEAKKGGKIGKESTNQPQKNKGNLLVIAIESVQKKPNQRNIRVWNTTSPSKEGADKREL